MSIGLSTLVFNELAQSVHHFIESTNARPIQQVDQAHQVLKIMWLFPSIADEVICQAIQQIRCNPSLKG
jgi:hypothetical protein